jgi:site-specific DNA-cytosine methylase
LEWAGFKTLWQIESDPYCQKILEKIFPHSDKYGDIEDVDSKELREAWIIVGGFPCQPYSIAGERDGEDDPRALWPEMLAIIEDKRPDWIICENVGGLLSLGIDQMLSDLEDRNYSPWPLVLLSAALDRQHPRPRTWIVAHSRSPRFEELHLAPKPIRTRHYPRPARGYGICGRISEPPILRRTHGLQKRLHINKRIEVLGNAVDPEIPYQIGRYIIKAMTHVR